MPFLCEEVWIGQSVALANQGGRVVVQNHVHARKAGCGCVFFLPVQRHLCLGLVAHLQEQRAGSASGVIHRGVCAGARLPNAKHARHDAADLCRCVKLALALATLSCKMPHQKFICVAKNVITVGAVLGEIQVGVLEDGN